MPKSSDPNDHTLEETEPVSPAQGLAGSGTPGGELNAPQGSTGFNRAQQAAQSPRGVPAPFGSSNPDDLVRFATGSPVAPEKPAAPAPDEAPGATAFVRFEKGGLPPPPAAPPPDEAPGATAFVRFDRNAPPEPVAPPPVMVKKAPIAPRKGLQVELPPLEDEYEAQQQRIVKPVRQIPQSSEEFKRGRRGNWWDAKSEKDQETDADVQARRAAEEAARAKEEAQRTLEEVRRLRDELKEQKEQPSVVIGTPAPEVVNLRPRPQAPQPERKRAPLRTEPPWKKPLQRGLLIAAGLAVLGLFLVIGAYVWVSRDIPTFDKVSDYRPLVASKVVTQDGTLVGQFYKERRTVVKMEQIPRILTQAVVSAEDKDFYKHPGFNFLALIRAAVVDTLSGRKRLGASTITQQVVKNFFLTSEKKWKRKLKEIVLAARLEHNLSKDDILYLYLNQINFGKAHYGVEEASLYYFNKHVEDIELGEAAILAGLPQNPSRINPRRHPDRAKARQIYVLDRMLSNKFITKEEHDTEVAKPIVLPPPPPEPVGAWYLDEVKRQLTAQYDEEEIETSGMTVEVAMDPRLQQVAEKAVQEDLRAVDKREGWRGAELKLEADRLDAYRAALQKRLGQVAQSVDSAWVLDLEPLHSAAVRKATGAKKPAAQSDDSDGSDAAAADVVVPDSPAPDVLARGARVRKLEEGGIYAGIVTRVGRVDAVVELAPGIAGSVPFSSMTWARSFKPEHFTPAPRQPSEVLAVGDVVPVRVTKLQTFHTSEETHVGALSLALEQTPKVQGAFAGMDLRTHEVLALVGGFDANVSSFNRATQAKRQPGSSFKPFLYAAALDTGKYTPATRVDDTPEVITDPWSGKNWKPQNFEKDQFDGPMSLRKALAESKNTVAVRLLLDVGLDKVRGIAQAAGLTSEIPQSYTAALGTGEVGLLEEINAYATFADGGMRRDPIFIRKILSRDGTTMFEPKDSGEQSIRPETAYLVSDVMRSVIDDPAGTAHGLSQLGHVAAGKTGTASEHRDGWFVGFTPQFIAGAWVGFDTHEMMGSLETGGHCAGPIWLNWMKAAVASEPADDWPPPPPGVTAVKINRNTGELARANDPYGVREVFLSGTEPQKIERVAEPDQNDWYQRPH